MMGAELQRSTSGSAHMLLFIHHPQHAASEVNRGVHLSLVQWGQLSQLLRTARTDLPCMIGLAERLVL